MSRKIKVEYVCRLGPGSADKAGGLPAVVGVGMGALGGRVEATGGGGAVPEGPAVEGGGALADWRIFRIESLSSFATLVVRVVTFCTRAGSLW